jgi:hypothetical protein
MFSESADVMLPELPMYIRPEAFDTQMAEILVEVVETRLEAEHLKPARPGAPP